MALQPRVPPRVSSVRSLEELAIAGRVRQFPRRGRDRDHHLNLREADPRRSHPAGDLAVLPLRGEEHQVVLPRDDRINVGVGQPFEWPALHPHAGIVAALDQYGLSVVEDLRNVASQGFERAGVNGLVICVARVERQSRSSSGSRRSRRRRGLRRVRAGARGPSRSRRRTWIARETLVAASWNTVRQPRSRWKSSTTITPSTLECGTRRTSDLKLHVIPPLQSSFANILNWRRMSSSASPAHPSTTAFRLIGLRRQRSPRRRGGSRPTLHRRRTVEGCGPASAP
jgi:hypothetical protein